MVFAGDLETLVFENQTYTRAWSSALCEIGTKYAICHRNLYETLDFLISLKQNSTVYYHNLKFDGKFWLSFLLNEMHFKQAFKYDESDEVIGFEKPKNLNNKEVIYSISDLGQWYSLTFKFKGVTITLKDSAKLLPFTLGQLLHDFKTEHQKLEMDYDGYKPINYTPTDEEKKYIANDVIGLAEALEIMFDAGHDKLTIGSCCMAEYKRLIGKYDFITMFPRLDLMTDVSVLLENGQIVKKPLTFFGYANVDEYIRPSYKGGWCYRVDGGEVIDCDDGTTADVNSLYPSMMSSESGNIYPVGKPVFWSGNYIPKQALKKDRQTGKCNKYYFIRFKCRFRIKENMLPFVQIKKNPLYKATEMLKTSDYYSKKDRKYYRYWTDKDGNVHDTDVTLTMTCTDFELFKEHYYISDFEIIDGCFFNAQSGIFDIYIDKYRELKENSTGAWRTIAKLFLNNLYGKLATSTNSSFKIAVIVDGTVRYKMIEQHDKKPISIACGSAVTSYSRNFTIRCAQMNYYGVGKRGFKYADTDSIHCDLPPEKLKGLKVDPKKFCCWKLESCWDYARFVRQKTYVEHVTKENLIEVEHPYYNVKCAGMPQKCKDLFLASLDVQPQYNEQGNIIEINEKDAKKYEAFLSKKHKITDFNTGLSIPGKLLPIEIKGGVVLYDDVYTMKNVRFF